jgi:mannose-6-phosphate isomerase-like protein (cupin superfamily)
MDGDSLTVIPLAGRVAGADDGDFVIAEWKDVGETGPERPIAPLHRHRSADEAFYVLEGALGFRLGDEVVESPAGGCVVVRAGTPHAYWNATPGLTRYLIVMTPEIARMIRELHEAAPDRTFEDVVAIFERYDSEMLL